MRTATDAVRSLKRYVAEVLGDDWEVRIAEEQSAFTRPFALVGPSGPELWRGPAHTSEVTLPTTVHCYPLEGENPEEALIRAMDCSELLYTGFRQGVGYGGPMRVPLWDYAGVPLNEVANTRVAYPGDDDHWHGDYMRIGDLSTNRIRDPDEPKMWSVVADVRLGWRRRGRLPSEREVLRSIQLTAEGDG